MMATPGRLQLRADLYGQLGSMTQAGLALPSALRTLAGSGAFRRIRAPLDRVIDRLEGGETLSEAAGAAPCSMDPFDRVLIRAGEESGRIDHCFGHLSRYYRKRAEGLRRSLAYMVYPLLVVHAAAFILPLPSLLAGSRTLAEYFGQAALVLVPCYLAALLVLRLASGRGDSAAGRALEAAYGCVPALGPGLRSLALSRFALALRSLLEAGVGMGPAWRMAGQASGASRLRSAAERVSERIGAGATPGEAMEEHRAFPELFSSLYRTGEASGRVDENLEILQERYQDSGYRSLELFATWLPRLIYYLIVILVAWHVIGFWVGHYDRILSD